MKRTPLKRTGRIRPKPEREKANPNPERLPLSDVPYWLALDGRRHKLMVERECRICGGPPASFHHVPDRSGGGLNVYDSGSPLCGDGVTGCHGKVEAFDREARRIYGENMAEQEVSYVLWLLGEVGGRSYLSRHYARKVPKLWPAWRGAGYYRRPRTTYDDA